ncbi:MAG: saccharopine dehydrogenase NADP-binding domain-containing protein [Candidatus Bathyarchaeia archaeon]|nr:saccharopine dehydrogenase NADP-binding domain-containing protein [Candidatus Bathyarchaeota archaeon]
MRVLILGCGNIGSVATEDLSRKGSIELVVADKLEGRARWLRGWGWIIFQV